MGEEDHPHALRPVHSWFDLAVDRVENLKNLARGLKKNAIAQDFINFKVEERSAKLAGLIVRELVETHGEQTKMRRNVSWLSRLGYEDRAREAYLEARGDLIHKRSRYVRSPCNWLVRQKQASKHASQRRRKEKEPRGQYPS